MEDSQLVTLTRAAIRETLKSETDHLKRGRVERNFTPRLANNIEASISTRGIQADPFYNKHLDAVKRLGGKQIELDIAVHAKGTDKNNLIAIELETINKPKKDDIWKLERITTKLDGYEYRLGLYLVFGIESKAGDLLIEDWYRNGSIIKP